MKRELALRLLQTTLPDLADEGAAANLLRELQFLADYKYNKYEMYHPGRLFLENLYLWLLQFDPGERQAALDFVRSELIFVSRQEFQQLADVAYHDIIRRRQIALAASLGGFPLYKVRAILESDAFKRVARGSLFVGMSDGARIDFLRRHNLDISNEQVLPYYETSQEKVDDLLKELRRDLGDGKAKFRCLFLIDDFCGSGRTLLREVVSCPFAGPLDRSAIPTEWLPRFKFNEGNGELELYGSALSDAEASDLRGFSADEGYAAAIEVLVQKNQQRQTVLKGALPKVAGSKLASALHSQATVFFCPLLATEHALDRLSPLLEKLPGQFASTQIAPAAVIGRSVERTSAATPIGALCDKYYTESLGDHHTGSVRFGFDDCGLPLVLHHNTPNNSLYLLWARKSPDVTPLFVRFERHGREGA